jgi:hypothetical protein
VQQTNGTPQIMDRAGSNKDHLLMCHESSSILLHLFAYRPDAVCGRPQQLRMHL